MCKVMMKEEGRSILKDGINVGVNIAYAQELDLARFE